jgi:RimJ/RimL family protein N-acetyltransferase
MFNYSTQPALASERHKAFIAEMDATRRVRQARSRRAGVYSAGRSQLRLLADWLPSVADRWRAGSGYPARGRRMLLRDGSTVLIRPVHGGDAPLLADGFARLSARSRRMRFLVPKKELSATDLRYFTEIDHHDHEALGAVDRASGRGVGVARYVRSAEDARSAEIAVTVVDEWQGRGLGTELLAQLSERAREEGIRRFTALVAADNVAVAELARTVGAELVRREPATVVYEVPLVPREGSGYTEAEQVKRSQTWIRAAGGRASTAGGRGSRSYRAGRRLWTLLNAQALLNGTAGTPDSAALVEDGRQRIATRRANGPEDAS